MLLDVENLQTYFHLSNGDVARAVDGVSFSVAPGETVALVGESGCGKSQTAFSIMRLLPPNAFHGPTSGITYGGKPLLPLAEEDMQKIRGNDIAMIFQEPMSSLNPLYRVGNQLIEPLMLHQGMAPPAARKRGIELLSEVGIPDPESRIDNFPHEMSGGMKQRVMIAMALACRPKLLIADEPTTALDVTIQAQILALIKELQVETGMGMIFITHDLGIVNQVADRVVVMYGGNVAEIGTREDIFLRAAHPYTRRLLASMPCTGDLEHKLHTIGGMVPSAIHQSRGCRFADRCLERLSICEQQVPLAHPAGVGNGSGHSAFCHLLVEGHERADTVQAQLEPRPVRPEQDQVLLKIENLATHFPVKRGLLMRTVNQVKAVDGFSLSLRVGETLALVGESGCGKTTVGQSLLRLIAEAKGRVLFDGKDLMQLEGTSLKRFRKELQIVFQDPFASLSPRLKVGDIVGEGLTVHHPELSVAAKEEKILSVLGEVGLSPEDRIRYPHEFSGGQRQRIALARALILEPRFLVLDEPTSALDVSVQSQVLNLLEDIQVRRRLTYLFITHDLGVVEYLADRVAVMYLGRMVEYAPVRQLFEHPRHPYTATLLQAVPRLGERKPFERIQGEVPSPLCPPKGCHFHPRCPFVEDRCRLAYPESRAVGGGEVACHRAENIELFGCAKS